MMKLREDSSRKKTRIFTDEAYSTDFFNQIDDIADIQEVSEVSSSDDEWNVKEPPLSNDSSLSSGVSASAQESVASLHVESVQPQIPTPTPVCMQLDLVPEQQPEVSGPEEKTLLPSQPGRRTFKDYILDTTDLNDLTTRDLRQIAKDLGITTGLRKAGLVQALEAHHAGDQRLLESAIEQNRYRNNASARPKRSRQDSEVGNSLIAYDTNGNAVPIGICPLIMQNTSMTKNEQLPSISSFFSQFRGEAANGNAIMEEEITPLSEPNVKYLLNHAHMSSGPSRHYEIYRQSFAVGPALSESIRPCDNAKHLQNWYQIDQPGKSIQSFEISHREQIRPVRGCESIHSQKHPSLLGRPAKSARVRSDTATLIGPSSTSQTRYMAICPLHVHTNTSVDQLKIEYFPTCPVNGPDFGIKRKVATTSTTFTTLFSHCTAKVVKGKNLTVLPTSQDLTPVAKRSSETRGKSGDQAKPHRAAFGNEVSNHFVHINALKQRQFMKIIHIAPCGMFLLALKHIGRVTYACLLHLGHPNEFSYHAEIKLSSNINSSWKGPVLSYLEKTENIWHSKNLAFVPDYALIVEQESVVVSVIIK